MNDLESGKAGLAELEELKEQCAALQRQNTNQLVALIVLACILCAFLYLQRRYAAADLAAIKQPATQIIQGYHTFRDRLIEFGKKNPDFRPILNKYGLSAGGTNSPPAPARPPASAAPQSAPKQ